MSLIAALALFGLGLAIVLFSAEQLVKGVVATSMAFRVSSFTIAVVFMVSTQTISRGSCCLLRADAWTRVGRDRRRGNGGHRFPLWRLRGVRAHAV